MHGESLPDFAKLAESYGHVSIVITSSQELESKLNEALVIIKRVFVDIIIDRSEDVYPIQVRVSDMNKIW
ncbi:MAG: thiamine pyrophosphate-dependent enzyme [Candidatus Malihini olakiniferum]